MSFSGLNYEYQVSVILSVSCPSSNKYIRDKYHLDHVLQWCALTNISIIQVGILHFEYRQTFARLWILNWDLQKQWILNLDTPQLPPPKAELIFKGSVTRFRTRLPLFIPLLLDIYGSWTYILEGSGSRIYRFQGSGSWIYPGNTSGTGGSWESYAKSDAKSGACKNSDWTNWWV